MEDLTGKKFGRLTVLKYLSTNKDGDNYWECQCDCGRICKAYEPALLDNRKIDCGKHNKFVDLTNFKYGKLTVIKKTNEKTKDNKILWLCQCKCGNTITLQTYAILSGRTRSCGCLRPELSKKLFSGVRQENLRLYRIWTGIKQRCYNEKYNDYKDYGAKGVIMCEDWKNNYESFYIWAINNGYSDSLSIDRIDTTGNYEPNNCRWADDETQANNKRNTLYFNIDGEKKSLHQICQEKGVDKTLIYSRLWNGWNLEDALNTPKLR